MSGQASSTKSAKIIWNRDLTLSLIELYEEHSNLWDVSSENYKNRNMRKASLEKISDVLKISAVEVSAKIHNLRCQFQTISRKRLKTKSGQAAGDKFVVKWEFYEALKFIDGPTTYTNETTIDSLSQAHATDSDEGDGDTPATENLESQDFLHLEGIGDNLSSDPATPEPSTSGRSSRSTTSTAGAKSTSAKRKKQDLQQQALFNRCLGVMSAPADSWEIFGDYVADELRNMSSKAPELQSEAKIKIQRALLDMNDRYNSRPAPSPPLNQHQVVNSQCFNISMDMHDVQGPSGPQAVRHEPNFHDQQLLSQANTRLYYEEYGQHIPDNSFP